MMTPRVDQDEFQAILDRLFQAIEADDILKRLRAKAWDRFLELGLPTKTSEVFRYLKLRTLFAKDYRPSYPTPVKPADLCDAIYPECKQSVIVFVNGHFQPQLSRLDALPKKVVITSLAEAMGTYSAFLNNQFAKTIKEETDPFALANAALHREGAFIYIPPKTVMDAPLQILHVIDNQEGGMIMHPRVHVFAASQSEAHFITNQYVLSGKDYFFNGVMDFAIEEDSHIRLNQIAMELDAHVWHLDATRASLKRNSTFKTIGASDGSQTVRNDYRVALIGENAEALLNGIWMLDGSNEFHAHVLIDHQAPNCHSMQLFKGVLNDFSQSSFEGKILVRQHAQKTDAFQLNNNLLLSDRAHADSKPNLEIFADDVKASHGSTIGQLDAEQIFYMNTRGISDHEAKNLLIYGYCKEVIDLITLPSVCQAVSQHARQYTSKE